MLEKFCDYLAAKGCVKKTVETYGQTVGGYMEWYQSTFGEPLQKLYRANVLDYISYLRTVRKLVNRSVNTKLAALKNLNDYLIETGVQTEVVLSKQDYLKVQTSYASPSTITRDQVEAFRQRVLEGSGKRNYAIVTVMAYAGLRISECLALSPEDVSLPAKEITVRSGKGGKTQVVFIGDKVVNAIKEYLTECPNTDRPYLFVSRRGGQLSREQVNRICKDYSDTITPHSLRHFYCSAAIEAGYSINEVANQAGHSNVHTTLLYTNPTREKMKEKANLL